MCMNCGCGQADQRHGNQANIVADDIRRASEAAGLDMATTVSNLRASLDRLEHGQSGAMWTSGGARGRSGTPDVTARR